MIIFIIFIIIFIFSIIIIINFVTQKKIGQETVIMLTGAPGTGKTKIGVSRTLQAYNKRLLLYALYQLKNKPVFYSNIPIVVKNKLIPRLLILLFRFKKMKKYEKARVLLYEHLTLQDRLEEYCVIFIDEVGGFASQYSHDNPFILQYLDKFIRFCRHYLDPVIYMTDQSSSNVVVHLRRRINTIYSLSTFRRVFLYFYKVNVDEVHISEDMMSIKETSPENQGFFFGHLPLKYFKSLDITRFFTYKYYESRCYLPLFNDIKFISEPILHGDLYTTYLIDLPNNAEMKQIFKKQGYITSEQMAKYIKIWQDKDKQ